MYSKKILIVFILLFISFVNISIAKQKEQVTFTGKVVDSEGNPIAGAKAELYNVNYGNLMYSYNLENTIEKTSDSNGTFTITLEVAHDDYSNKIIVVKKDGYAVDSIGWNVWDSKTGGEFRLSSPMEISGIVVDENDKPVSGSSVNILMMRIGEHEVRHEMNINVAPRLYNTITDDKGEFSFSNLPSNAGVDFIVRKEGRATISTYVSGSPASEQFKFSPRQENIKIVQPEESRIDGIVVDKESGKPLAGIPLMLRGNNNYQIIGQDVITSDDDGQFSIKGICAGKYNIIYVAPKEETSDWIAHPESFVMETGQVRNDIKVELIKGGLLEVLITEEGSNKPIEDATVSLYSEQSRQSFNGKSDKDGIVTIRLLPGVYQAPYAYGEGYSSYQTQDSITIEEGVTKHFDWQLGSMPEANGVVSDESGKPVKGVKIGVLPGGYGRDVKSNQEGKFEISWDTDMFMNVNEDPLLICRSEEENLAKVIILDGNTENLDIKLMPGLTLTGKVTDPEGNSIENASIRAMLRQTMWASTFIPNNEIKTNKEGVFEIKAVPAEQRYELTIVADGYGNQKKDIHADDAINNILDAGIFTLPVANLSVSGIIVDTDGNPVPNARIEARDYEGGQPENLNTQTDANGKFVLEGVCKGKVNIRIRADLNGKRINARATADGGTTGIKIVASERGEYLTQNFTNIPYEQIIEENELIIAGTIVDEDDKPVAGVSVRVNCIRREREDAPGKYMWTFSSYNDLTSRSDDKGRFVIALEEDLQYDLVFTPHDYAAMFVYDVPAGNKDLKVILTKGGTISGQLVRKEGDKNIPIPNVEVKLEQSDRASYTHLGFDQDKSIITDSEGRFKFEKIQTRIKPHESMGKSEWEYVPRVWKLVYGDKTQTFAFYDNPVINDFEFVIGNDLANSKRLKGNTLTDFKGIDIDYDISQADDKKIILCFFDIEQRPSRSCLLELSKKESELKEKNIEVIAIHSTEIEREYLNTWFKENGISFPVGIIESSTEQAKYDWGVKALPWLILTDEKHLVIDEGFSINELDEKIKD